MILYMRITTFTDYSLRVLIQAALRHPQKITVDEVAAAYGISRNHLIKIVHELGRAGFIATQRGRSGGFTLARPANRISIADVVKFGESGHPVLECFDPANNACVITPACRLKGIFAKAMSAFYAALDQHTLADVMIRPDALLRHLGLSAA